ncbi:hypothetical protein D9M72_644730 [compost metagenome]
MGDGGSDNDGESAGVERLAGLGRGVDPSFGDQRPAELRGGDLLQQGKVGACRLGALARVTGQGGANHVGPCVHSCCGVVQGTAVGHHQRVGFGTDAGDRLREG